VVVTVRVRVGRQAGWTEDIQLREVINNSNSREDLRDGHRAQITRRGVGTAMARAVARPARTG
jgi:hypothetical protein